jgi:hypothetical protein
MISTNKIKTLPLLLIGLIFLTACGQDQEKTPEKKVALVLSKENVRNVILNMGKDYDQNMTSLLTHFDLAKNNKNEHHFIEYRNREWSPKYIEEKNFYSEIYSKNVAFIEKNQLTPIFHHFENLIFVGLHLKHGLINKDDALIEKTLGEAKAEQNEVHTIVKSYQ